MADHHPTILTTSVDYPFTFSLDQYQALAALLSHDEQLLVFGSGTGLLEAPDYEQLLALRDQMKLFIERQLARR